MFWRPQPTPKQIRTDSIKMVLSLKGLELDKFEKIQKDTHTFTLLKSGTLKSPLLNIHRDQSELTDVWLVKGFRVEQLQAFAGNGKLGTQIDALIGEYLSAPYYEFLGRHNGKEWMNDTSDYRPPFSTPTQSSF